MSVIFPIREGRDNERAHRSSATCHSDHSRALTRWQSVLLLGNYRPALTIARALSRLNYRVIVSRGGGEGGAEFSRYVDEVWHHPELTSGFETEFVNALVELCLRRDIVAIYPVAEEFVICLSQHAKMLPPHVLFASPCLETVQLCIDKPRMLQHCRELGIPCEPFRIATDHAELFAASSEVKFPIVIRPVAPQTRLLQKKAIICNDVAQLERLFPHWPEAHAALLVQHKARGERHNIFFAAKRGQIVRAIETRILRTDRIDGTGLAVDGKTVQLTPELLDDTAKLVASMNYTGVGLTQFIVEHDSGSRCFLELNPRIAGSHAIADQSGAELSRLGIEVFREGASSLGRFSYPVGLRYAWTYGDLRGLKGALEGNEITISNASMWLCKAIWTFVCARRHMTWCCSDPMPTIMLFLRQLGIDGLGGVRRTDARCVEVKRA